MPVRASARISPPVVEFAVVMRVINLFTTAAAKVETMSGFKKPNFVDRQDSAAKAKRAALEKFRASAADPAFEERLGVRIAGAAKRSAARNVRETEKVENKLREAERAQQAERDAAIQAEHAAAESANREAERKAARDARYAARKSRSKR